MSPVLCPICAGTGIVDYQDGEYLLICDACKGTGRIEEMDMPRTYYKYGKMTAEGDQNGG